MKKLDPAFDTATPGALRIIAERLKSDDMIEYIVLNGAADEIDRMRKFIALTIDAYGTYPEVNHDKLITDAKECLA